MHSIYSILAQCGFPWGFIPSDFRAWMSKTDQLLYSTDNNVWDYLNTQYNIVFCVRGYTKFEKMREYCARVNSAATIYRVYIIQYCVFGCVLCGARWRLAECGGGFGVLCVIETAGNRCNMSDLI